jgi:hypothetical protein
MPKKIKDGQLLLWMEKVIDHDVFTHNLTPHYFYGNNTMEIMFSLGPDKVLDAGSMDKGGEYGVCEKKEDDVAPWYGEI